MTEVKLARIAGANDGPGDARVPSGVGRAGAGEHAHTARAPWVSRVVVRRRPLTARSCIDAAPATTTDTTRQPSGTRNEGVRGSNPRVGLQKAHVNGAFCVPASRGCVAMDNAERDADGASNPPPLYVCQNSEGARG